MSQNICNTCKGTGKCPACTGAGVFAPTAKSGGAAAHSANLCASCFGSGKCRDCQGKKRTMKDK